MTLGADDMPDVAAAALARLTGLPAAAAASAVVEEGWHLLAVPEERGGWGGDVRLVADLVGSLAAAGVAAPVLELHLGSWAADDADDGRVVGLTWWDGAGWVAPWGRALDAAVDLGSGRLTGVRTDGEGEDLAHEPVDPVAVDPDLGGERGWTASPLLARYAVLQAARVLGACRAAVDRTAAYCREREQFGRPILSFQLVAAELGDAMAEVLLLEAAVGRALGTDDSERLRYAAAALAAEVATTVARTAHQLHGAIGVTQELGLDRLTRRLWAWPDRGPRPGDWERLAGAGGEAEVWSRGPEVVERTTP